MKHRSNTSHRRGNPERVGMILVRVFANLELQHEKVTAKTKDSNPMLAATKKKTTLH